MTATTRRTLWLAGLPARVLLLGMISGYRATAGRVLGGGCRFYPSCSEYAREAIRSEGALRGVGFSAWRIARCSPLSRGGVDPPPAGRDRARGSEHSAEDTVIQVGCSRAGLCIEPAADSGSEAAMAGSAMSGGRR